MTDIAAFLESNSLKITRNAKGSYSWEFKLKWNKKKIANIIKESQEFDRKLREIYLKGEENGRD